MLHLGCRGKEKVRREEEFRSCASANNLHLLICLSTYSVKGLLFLNISYSYKVLCNNRIKVRVYIACGPVGVNNNNVLY
jgi:hypothetical protein